MLTETFAFLKGKLTPILIGAIIIMAGVIAFQQKKIVNTMSLYTTSVANEKAAAEGLVIYKDKYNREHARTRAYTYTVDDLKSANDNLTVKLRNTIKESDIKAKNVTQAGIIRTEVDVTLTGEIKPQVVTIIDTIKKDTLKKVVSVLDTTINLSTKDVTNIITIKNNKIESKISIENEQSIITSSKKETVKPRKKFFLWRWFQKKHWVTQVEVINSNPLIKTKEQKFIIFPENQK